MPNWNNQIFLNLVCEVPFPMDGKTFPIKNYFGFNSNSQRKYIMGQARERGHENLEVITADINGFETKNTFDRVVSVEMFEHVRNHRELFIVSMDGLTPEENYLPMSFAIAPPPTLLKWKVRMTGVQTFFQWRNHARGRTISSDSVNSNSNTAGAGTTMQKHPRTGCAASINTVKTSSNFFIGTVCGSTSYFLSLAYFLSRLCETFVFVMDRNGGSVIIHSASHELLNTCPDCFFSIS